MSSEVAIQTRDLGKAFAIYRRPEDRLKQMVWQLLWRGRRKFYEEFWALRNIDLEVRRGETIGIVGKNGSGKSTLLQLLSGTLTPTTGEAIVRGRVAALLELGAGFNPEFTGRENVHLAGTVLGLTARQVEERFEAIESFAGIGEFIDQPVKLYSSGMYARLAFAVAAHVDADILIIDEILSVGDVAFNQKCMRFIRRFRENGTLFFVSHDTGAVVNLCDRVVWLDRGEVREIGGAKDVCHNYVAAATRERDGIGTFRTGGACADLPSPPPTTGARRKVQRDSNRHNEVEVFDFNSEALWFGQRGATVERVSFGKLPGEQAAVLEGGEDVVLTVRCFAEVDLASPIIGFYLRDRLGQQLFGDNTFLTHADNPVLIAAGEHFSAEFHFQLPFLPTGDYSITVAVADGTQAVHSTHHWLDDAVFFRVHTSHVCRGLIGIPMSKIALTVGREKKVRSAP